MNDKMIRIPFDGDTIEGIKDETGAWVTLSSLCNPWGKDPNGQAQKLKRLEWATTCKKHVVAADGKIRSVVCIHMDSVPGWWFTLGTADLEPEKREKLVRYQKGGASALRDYFFGKTEPATQLDAGFVRALLAEHFEPLRAELAVYRSENVELRATIREIRDGRIATATKTELDFIATLVSDLSALRRHAGDKRWRAVNIRQEMAKVARWGARPGDKADCLPSASVPYAQGWLELEIGRLERAEREAARVKAEAQRLASEARQQKLDFDAPN
jgi:hypothetical protein